MKTKSSLSVLLALLVGLLQLPALSAHAATAPPGWDTAPQGDWAGVYGTDGHVLAAWHGTSDSATLSPGISVSLTQGARHRWSASTTDVRALENAAETERRAAAWYAGTAVKATITFTGAYQGPLHVYALDWDATGRRQTITVSDGATSTDVLLDSDFSEGAWAHYDLNVGTEGGTVTVTATNTGGANAVLSGLFLGEQLSEPRDLTAVPSSAQVDLSWNAPIATDGETVTGYDVYRGTSPESLTLLGTSPTTSVTSYSDTAVTNGTTYYYEVAAVTSTQTGPRSSQVSATPASVPGAPSGLSASAVDHDQVDLSWSAPVDDGGSAVTSYNVYRGTTSGSLSLLGSSTATSYSDTSVVGDTQYFYAVSAVNSTGEGAKSEEATETTPAKPFSQAPQGDWVGVYGADGYVLSAWESTSDLVSLPAGVSVSLTQGTRYRWTSSSTLAQALESPDESERRAAAWYHKSAVTAGLSFTDAYAGDLAIYMVDWDNSGRRQTVTVNDGAATSVVIDESFAAGAWVVVPIDASAGETVTVTVTKDVGANAVVSGLFLDPATTLTAPQDLAATGGSGQVDLSWSAPASTGGETITGYDVYRGTSPESLSLLGTSPTTSVTSYSDTAVTDGTTYYYEVAAVTSTQTGPRSSQVSATPAGVPGAPSGLTASAVDHDQVDLSWSAPVEDGGSAVTSYNVYRGTTSGSLSLLGSSTATSYSDTSVVGDTQYFYAVSAVNSAGEGAKSEEATETTPAKPFSQAPQGDWVGVYGADGHVLSAWNSTSDLVSLPEGVSVSLTQGTRYRWTSSTTSLKALESPDESTRRAAAWYHSSAVTAGLSFTDAYVGDLAIYMVDWDNAGRRQTVTVNDGADTSVAIDESFASGAWVVVSIDASVGETVTVTVTKDLGLNAVVSGLFLGGTPAISAPLNLTATAGDTQVSLDWDAPTFDGGSAIASYNIYRGTATDGLTLQASSLDTLYTDTAVTNGTTYFYEVTAVNEASQESPRSSQVSATPAGVPGAPSGLTASAVDHDQVDLSWSAPVEDGGSAVTSYNVYRGTTSGSLSLLGSSTATSYSDTSVVGDTQYFYAVSAVNSTGEGAKSEEATETTPAKPFSQAPQGDWVGVYGADGYVLSAWESTSDLVSLPAGVSVSLTQGTRYRWTSSSTLAQALESPDESERRAAAWYHKSAVTAGLSFTDAYAGDLAIYMVDWDNSGRRQTVTVNDGAATSVVIDESFAAGAWVVVPIDASAGETVTVTVTKDVGANAVVSGLFLDPATTLTAPQDLAATGGSGQVDLSWSAPASTGGETITGYDVYRGTSPESLSLLGTSPTTSVTSYSDTAVTDGTTYYYEVAAVTSTQTGPRSSQVSATPAGVPGAPSGLTASAVDHDQVDLSWSAPVEDGGSAVTSYNVYRGTTSGSLSLLGSSTATSYSDTSVVGDTQYFYAVSAVNSAGEGAKSEEATETTPAKPFSQAPQGDWVGVYGADGHVLSAWNSTSDLVSLPEGVSVSLTQGTRYRWTSSTTSLKALESPDESTRRAAAWYHSSAVTAGLSFTDAYVGDLAIYMVDWDNAGRRQTVTVNDGADTSVAIDESFASGAWVVVSIDASVGETVTVTVTKDLGLNAVVSGLFLGGTPAISAPLNLTATAGDTQVSLDWDAPTFDGGSAIASYNIYRGTATDGLTLQASSLDTLYTDTAVTNGTTYFYEVTAVNEASQESPRSSQVSATPAGVPGAPSGLTASAVDHDQVDLSWSAPVEDGGSAVTSYNVYRGTTSGSLSLLGSSTATSYSDTSVVGDTQYFYAVSAVNSTGEGAKSEEATETTPAKPFSQAPQGDWVGVYGADGYVLSAWESTSDLVSLPAGVSVSLTQGTRYRWTSSSTLAQALESPDESERRAAAWYHKSAVTAGLSFTDAYAGDLAIYMVDWDNSGRRQTVTVNDGAATSVVIDESFAAGAWVVVPIDASAGETVTVTVTKDVGANAVVSGLFLGGAGMSPPTGLTATAGDGQVQLSWTAPTHDGGSAIASYNVYRGTTSGALSLYDSSATTSYTDTAVTNGTTYHYEVTAVNSTSDESPASSEASATPEGAPSAPQDVTATAGNGQVTVAWSAPANDGGSPVTGYTVSRSTAVDGTYTDLVTTTETSYVDTSVTNGTQYFYRVVAHNEHGTSEASTPVSATPTAA